MPGLVAIFAESPSDGKRMANETDDEILLRASELLAEQRRMLADVERKLIIATE